MRILIDTNVIIDALTSRKPWNESAEKIFIMAANNIIEMYITASSATDIYYLVRKHLQSKEQSKQVMSKLYTFVGILDVIDKDCLEALVSQISDYEDAVIEQVARRTDMDYIITRNTKDFEYSYTDTILPDDFVKMLEEND